MMRIGITRKTVGPRSLSGWSAMASSSASIALLLGVAVDDG